jgi:uncharacterized protein (DUF1697 family)
MSRYVAFLRGINVGGRVVLPMARLRALFATLGFADVTTILQSGNVLFEAPPRSTDLLCRRIEPALHELTGAQVRVILRTLHELEALVRNEPFADIPLEPGATRYVSFLSQKSGTRPSLPLVSAQGDVEILRINRLVVLAIGRTRGGRSGVPNSFIETALGVPATTRAWKTLVKIVDERAGAPDAGAR